MASGDFDLLSNEQLREELLARGQNVGPVMETTRNIYLKKLKKLADTVSAHSDKDNIHTTEPFANDMRNGFETKPTNMVRELDSIKDNNDAMPQDALHNGTGNIRQNITTDSHSPRTSPQPDECDHSDENSDDDGYYGEETSRYLSTTDPRYMESHFDNSCMRAKTTRSASSLVNRTTWILRFLFIMAALIAAICFYNSKIPTKVDPEEEL